MLKRLFKCIFKKRKKKYKISSKMYGQRGILKKISGSTLGKITVLLYGDYDSSEDSIVITLSSNFCVEEICQIAAQKLGIGTLSFPLFSLYDLKKDVWLYPNAVIKCHEDLSPLYVFRMRFMVPPLKIINVLESLDEDAFLYMFKQCRHDFLNECYTRDPSFKRDDVLGLVVADLVRYSKDKNVDSRAVKNWDWKHFIPYHQRDLFTTPWSKHRLRANFMEPLREQAEKHKSANANKLKLNFILSLLDFTNKRGVEEFTLGDGGTLVVNPFREKDPGIYTVYMHDDQPDEIYFSQIEDLISIAEPRLLLPTDNSEEPSMCSVLVNRKSGRPNEYKFLTLDEAYSFMALVSGYHRLMADYHMELCPRKVYSPILEHLHKIGCHGPVSKKWASDRLKKHFDQDVQMNHLLKQQTGSHNTYILVYIENSRSGSPEVKFYIINTLPSGTVQLGLPGEPEFKSMSDLLSHYRKDHEDRKSKINLMKSVRPSGNLDDKLYLCRDENAKKVLDDKPKQQRAAVALVSSVQLDQCLGQGHFTEVYYGSWEKDHSTENVAVKQLRQEEAKKNLQYFTFAIHKACFWTDATIVAIHALCLAPNFCALMEYGELGTLENYLRQPKKQLMMYNLLMMAEQLAQALNYLETRSQTSSGIKNDECHGNIRTRNILVFHHEDTMIRIKLGDPGMVYAYNKLDLFNSLNAERIAWLAPELFNKLDAITPYSDRYAYGMTLWEIMSQGERPFTHLEGAREIKQYVESKKTLKKPHQECPDKIYELMHQCWHHNPESRISAKEIVRDIVTLIQNDYSTERYDVPKWHLSNQMKQSTSALPLHLPPNSAAIGLNYHDGPYGINHNPVVIRDLASSSDSMTGSAQFTLPNQSSMFHPQSNSVTSSQITLNVDSGTPLITPLPHVLELDSTAGSMMSCTTVDTNIQDEAEDTEKEQFQTVQVPSIGKSMLKRPLPKTPEMPEPIEALRHEDLQIDNKGLLGKGYYGQVKKGYFTTKHGQPRPVAIKSLNPDLYHKHSLEFEREFRIMIPLKHTRIVEIIGHCPQKDEKNPMLLVMEFVENGALKNYLQKNKNHLNLETLIRFALEISEGMQYLQDKCVCHCDLAARNILVTRGLHMKITDFGMSRAISDPNSFYKMTPNKDKIFPALWYAPEALMQQQYNSQADVWSFGVTVWETFSYGETPSYPLDNIPKQLLPYLHKGNRLEKPKSCPDDIYDCMKECWDYKPENRLTFKELVKTLSQLHEEYKGRDSGAASKS